MAGRKAGFQSLKEYYAYLRKKEANRRFKMTHPNYRRDWDKKNPDYYRRYYQKHKVMWRLRYLMQREAILQGRKEEVQRKLGTTDLGSHSQPDEEKEAKVIQNEIWKLGLGGYMREARRG
jgi:hypothetical protein